MLDLYYWLSLPYAMGSVQADSNVAEAEASIKSIESKLNECKQHLVDLTNLETSTVDDFNRVESEFDGLVDSLRGKRIDLIKKSMQFCIDRFVCFLESDEEELLELRKMLGCSRNVVTK